MSLPKHILVIDDDPVFRIMLETFLIKNHYSCISVDSAAKTMKVLKKEVFDLILLDLRLPDKNGLDLLKEIKLELPKTPMILMTSFVDVRTAIKAIKSGAFEYITKPLNTDELKLAIENALKSSELTTEKQTGKNSFDYQSASHHISQEIVSNIQMVAPTNLSVLVTGESGTGKEYVARMIHMQSKRSAGKFVAIDCGVLSSELAASELFGHLKGAFTGAIQDKVGYFEIANGGTIFLDEIGNLSPDVQVMLLRAVQERQIKKIGDNKTIEIDIRIIAATNEDLKAAVLKGSFREDLYHRLQEFTITVPPLRERPDDIMPFALLFLKQANEELERSVEGIDEGAEKILKSYSWPGNLRELKNIVKRSVLMTAGKLITAEILPAELSNKSSNSNPNDLNSFDLKEAGYKQEKDYIIRVLEKVRYNKSTAARVLNIDRKTLYNKLKQFGIDL